MCEEMRGFYGRMRMSMKLCSGSALFVLALTSYLWAETDPLVKDVGLGPILLPPLQLQPEKADWEKLEIFNETLTSSEFKRRLSGLYDPFDGMAPHLKVDEQGFSVMESAGSEAKEVLRIGFAKNEESKKPVPRWYRTPFEFKEKSQELKPLEGLRIVIDPADIGGEWGRMEDRSSKFRGYGKIQEGDLNLVNGLLLRDKLKALGAEVRITREQPRLVSPYKKEDFINQARDMIKKSQGLPPSYFTRTRGLAKGAERRVEILTEILLTKTYETRYRAHKMGDFKPEITLVLQHNATSASAGGKFARINRNVFFVPGSFSKGELKDGRQRYQLVKKLVQASTPFEVQVASSIARAFRAATGFPPVKYGNSAVTRIVTDENEYVVARNLAVTREFMGPVVVVEAYFMNERGTLRRLLEGHYEGKRLVSGKMQKSIYAEYTDAVVKGLVEAYANPK